jgi:adenylate cyclase
VRDRPLILVVDDYPENLDIVRVRMEARGYDVVTAADGQEALDKAYQVEPDIILLDVVMPVLDGISVAKRLKSDPRMRTIPIVLLTAKSDSQDLVEGLEAGADDYLTKPFDHAALVARVRSLLRVKSLYDTVQHQADQLAELNRSLEERVARQVAELEQARSLRRFLAPQLAEMLLSQGVEAGILEHHRREIVVLFCDLRGFTAFAEVSEPEEVMDLLNTYHATLGPLVHGAEGTLERFTGDGLMIFFNDPVPCFDPAIRAASLAVAMRDAVADLSRSWTAKGYSIGFGIGIAQGYATLGRIGFEGRFDYAAIGTVTNVAARLCAEAQDGQILVTHRVASEIEPIAHCEPIGDLQLRGLSRPVSVYNVEGLGAPG